MAFPTLSPWFALEFVAGLAMAALALWVLAIDPRSPVNRAFALLFVVRGVMNVVLSFAESADLQAFVFDSFWSRAYAYFALAMPFAVLHFVHRYRVRYSGARRIPGAGVVLAALALAGIGAYVAEPALYLGEGGGRGPLAWTNPVFYLGYGILAALFLRDHLRDGSRSALHLGIAFGLLPVATMAAATGRALAAVARGEPGTVLFFGWTGVALYVAAGLPPFLVLLGRRRGPEGAEPPAGRSPALGVLAFAAGSGLVAAALARVSTSAPGLSIRVVDQVWTAAFVVLVTYALVRHQLLDVDVKVQWGVSRSTVAAVFIAVFFVASETAQQFFQGSIGTYLGIAAAGTLVFAMAPLQRVAQSLAERAVPLDATGPAAKRGEAAFRAAVRLARRDKALSPEDEVQLAELAETLGIGAGRALAILREDAPTEVA